MPDRFARLVVAVVTGVTLVGLSAGRAGPAMATGTPPPPVVAAGGRPVPATVPVAATVPVTPILSVRRLPDWIEDDVADRRLAAGLPAVLAPLGPALHTSCLTVSEGDRVIYTDNPVGKEVPASNLKLLTATAVLDKLGAGTRIRTTVTGTGRRSGGTLHGNLYLVGAGDPLLWTPAYDAAQDPAEPLYTSLAQLAAQVHAAGITRVDGGVIGDESLFDTRRAVPSWKPSYTAEDDVGPLSALDVDNGFRLTRPFGAAARPAVLAANVFTSLLDAAGVRVAGRGSAGISPPAAVPVTSIRSAPMASVVDAVLRVSDDTGAELLTKLLGRRFGGAGTTVAGVAVTRAALASDGLPVSEMRTVDGSGLSTADRVSCTLLLDDLRHVGTGGVIFAGLPVAGRSGTLATRMVGTVAAGRVHAKTGTLDGVSALSGFVMPAAGRGPTPALRQPLVFSFLANGIPDDSIGIDVGDALGVDLARFPDVPPLADAGPRGAAARIVPVAGDR